jgi:DNA uptake protein ComE-like DNA-binding protein
MNRFIAASTLLLVVACQKKDASSRDSAAGALADTTTAAAAKTPDSTSLASPGQPASGTTGAVTGTQAGALLDPNTATKQQLTAIHNITPALADSVIAHRPYENMVGVNKVLAGLSKQQRDTVYISLFKPLDLNTAVDEEILSIPGIGNRMLREFKEYRPYKNIDQFRREIGKYVPKEEVARLERYVTIKQ